ncbi:response regulator [Myxococcota bacterium]|nr:response regulator [Myxococcota bacterium]
MSEKQESNEKQPLRVLVVDDNPLIRDSFAAAISRLNTNQKRSIHVAEASDGATAWGVMEKFGADLIVVDLYIPVMTGLDLITKIRDSSDLASTKILAISASIEDARSRSLEAGADVFLQKPLRLVELVDSITNLLKL